MLIGRSAGALSPFIGYNILARCWNGDVPSPRESVKPPKAAHKIHRNAIGSCTLCTAHARNLTQFRRNLHVCMQDFPLVYPWFYRMAELLSQLWYDAPTLPAVLQLYVYDQSGA